MSTAKIFGFSYSFWFQYIQRIEQKLLICRLQLPIDSYSSNGCFSLLFMTDSCSKVYLSDTELSIEYPITPPTMQQKENTAQEASKSRPHNYSSRQPPSSNWIQTFLAFGHMPIRVKCFIRQERLCFHFFYFFSNFSCMFLNHNIFL